MAAWVLVRYKTKTSKLIFTIFSVAVLVPFQCVMLPLLAEMGKLNMINMPGLMLVNLGFGSSMSIILFHGFMKNVPVELEEAASIDGASQPRIFFTIVLPLIKGIAVTVAILNVMSLWNDYLLPSLTINEVERKLFLFGLICSLVLTQRNGSWFCGACYGNYSGNYFLCSLSEVTLLKVLTEGSG